MRIYTRNAGSSRKIRINTFSSRKTRINPFFTRNHPCNAEAAEYVSRTPTGHCWPVGLIYDSPDPRSLAAV